MYMKVKPTGLPGRLDVMYNRKRQGEYDFINSGLSNWKNGSCQWLIGEKAMGGVGLEEEKDQESSILNI